MALSTNPVSRSWVKLSALPPDELPESCAKFCTCCTWWWIVWKQEVATLLVDTGIRLKGYMKYAKGKNIEAPFAYSSTVLFLEFLQQCPHSLSSAAAPNTQLLVSL